MPFIICIIFVYVEAIVDATKSLNFSFDSVVKILMFYEETSFLLSEKRGNVNMGKLLSVIFLFIQNKIRP